MADSLLHNHPSNTATTTCPACVSPRTMIVQIVRDEDVWNLDHYLAKILGYGMKRLREIDHGHPGGVTMDEWRAILDEMATGFQQYADAEDNNVDADYLKLDRSLELLRRWFPHLWD